MSALVFDNVVKRFPGAARSAVNHISVEIDEGEFITIVGSSGCGKTTLLRMVNRLCEPDSGSVLLFGQDIRDENPDTLRRGIGYVIQEVGLFPHMTIAQNSACVLRILKWDKDRIKARAAEMLRLVNLDPGEFSGRYPSQLSGGQKQRVGLARALAADPRVMLLDEPFGAIDAINRTNLQNELLQIHRANKRTYLFVTHDIGEAFKLGSRVLILHQGEVQQFDTPQNILRAPAPGFVQELINSSGAAASYEYGGEGI